MVGMTIVTKRPKTRNNKNNDHWSNKNNGRPTPPTPPTTPHNVMGTTNRLFISYCLIMGCSTRSSISGISNSMRIVLTFPLWRWIRTITKQEKENRQQRTIFLLFLFLGYKCIITTWWMIMIIIIKVRRRSGYKFIYKIENDFFIFLF